MQKETKYELNKMFSLMERMDKHYTSSEAQIIDEQITEIGAEFRNVVGPEEFYDLLEGTPKGSRITFGYVTGAKIVVPKGKKLNPATNRMNQFDDYEALGKSLGVNGKLVSVIKLAIYNFPWQTTNSMKDEYSKWKQTRDDLSQKYGVEVGKARYGTDTNKIGANGGIISYNGNNDELSGHTYTNINMFNIKPISTKYYLVMDDGRLEEISKDKLEFLPYKQSNSIIDKLLAAGATQAEVEPLLKMNYTRFEHSHILFFSATPDSGIPTVFINSKLSDKIGGITNVNPDEIIGLAKQRYSKFMEPQF